MLIAVFSCYFKELKGSRIHMNFGGRGGMGNMSQMLKQAQAMQAKMMQAQEELKQARVEGSAGGGMPTATHSP